jgi:NAD(P)H-quinone oxidoreductase subunit I
LPYKVTNDPMVTPIREFAYLPAGVMEGHDQPANQQRAGQRPEEIAEQEKLAQPTSASEGGK